MVGNSYITQHFCPPTQKGPLLIIGSYFSLPRPLTHLQYLRIIYGTYYIYSVLRYVWDVFCEFATEPIWLAGRLWTLLVLLQLIDDFSQ